MRIFATILFLLIVSASGPIVSLAQAQDLPTGTIAEGRIDPVPGGNLHVGVLDATLAPRASTEVGGPPAFIVNEEHEIEVDGLPQGSKKLGAGAAAFLPGGKTYRVINGGSETTRFRFVGMGQQGEVKGAHYEMEPMFWGPCEGKACGVSLSRSFFSGGGATPWHYHNGPAFGILDAGDVWENRQADGDTRRIPAPGYYVQQPLKVHQLAQVGAGGYALIFQFAPPGQPLTGGGAALAPGTPTVLTLATALSTPQPQTTATTASRTSLTSASTALAGRPPPPRQEDNSLLYAVIILGLVALATVLMRRR
jgi:hypothetical protein